MLINQSYSKLSPETMKKNNQRKGSHVLKQVVENQRAEVQCHIISNFSVGIAESWP